MSDLRDRPGTGIRNLHQPHIADELCPADAIEVSSIGQSYRHLIARNLASVGTPLNVPLFGDDDPAPAKMPAMPGVKPRLGHQPHHGRVVSDFLPRLKGRLSVSKLTLAAP